MSHATGHDATTPPAGVRVDRYAAARGEKVDTVRKRIQRGQLAAYKGADHRWYVVEELAPVTTQDTTRRDGAHDGTHDATRQDRIRDTRHDPPGAVAVSPNARAQLEAVRDEWLAPLVAQITAQAERIGQLEAERDAAAAARLAAERERDELRARLSTMVGPAPTPPAAPGDAAGAHRGDDTPRRLARLWQRLRRALGA